MMVILMAWNAIACMNGGVSTLLRVGSEFVITNLKN
jgi:hypothetical protein